MAFYVNNKKFLNYEEQVLENKTKIKDLETSIGQGLPFQFKVWKEGDRIFDVSRQSKCSRTFIALTGRPEAYVSSISFRKSNGDILNNHVGEPILITDKVFYIHYDIDHLEVGKLYIHCGDDFIISEVISDFINLSTGLDRKLLEIVV